MSGINQSAELIALAVRWIGAWDGRHPDPETAANLFYSADCTRYIGTASHEWWQGRTLPDGYRAHMKEHLRLQPVMEIEVQDVEAYEAGAVGWAAMRTRTVIGNSDPATVRITFVFALESGIWRIVQAHLSAAVPNPDLVGVELTGTLEDLLASIGPAAEEMIRNSVREGTVTLMFTDIEDSTTLATSIGDEEWARVIHWHDQTIQNIVEGGGGTLVKTLGDGAMAVFESLRAAARSAFQIQRAFAERQEGPAMRVRIGLHVGDVMLTNHDYLGKTVNKAARITAAAQGGQIRVSSSVRALLSDDPEFGFGETQRVELKGIDGLHDIASLIPGEANRV
ncbi:MAG TPA: adenylate/guanylate cyclase domain-containing protein [Acidimicrobiia bacterium]|nr:adenylate/guanylate cyclase domain-containing protein [Acidimicrobiia bacterium]